jgi:hypothetical protein
MVILPRGLGNLDADVLAQRREALFLSVKKVFGDGNDVPNQDETSAQLSRSNGRLGRLFRGFFRVPG